MLCWLVAALVHFLPIAWLHANILHALDLLNLPAILFQVPWIILSPDRSDWRPPGVDLYLWRAISWPLLAFVFWWIAGRALEALLALRYRVIAPRITMIEAVVAFFIMAGGGMIVTFSLIFDFRKLYSDFDSATLVTGGGLWTLLGALSVVARFRQWRLRRTIERSSAGLQGPSAVGAPRN